MEFRHYHKSDYEAVCDFLKELNTENRDHISWNWARFEWMTEHPLFDQSKTESIGLWFDQNSVVGAAVFDQYFGEAFCGALPQYAHLYPELLEYAIRDLKDENGLMIAVNDRCGFEIESLRNAGFVRTSEKEIVMRMDLNHLPSLKLPEGFCFEEIDHVKQGKEFQWLMWQGFDHGNDYEQFLEKGITPVKERMHFNPQLSLAARSESGEYAGYCCVWYCGDTDYAYVEPLCTVPSYRDKGIASALLSQALNRARSLGANEAYVISDLAFYQSFGFERFQEYTFYCKSCQLDF